MATRDHHEFEQRQRLESTNQHKLRFKQSLRHDEQRFQLWRLINFVAVVTLIAPTAVSAWVIAHPEVYRDSVVKGAMGIMCGVVYTTANILGVEFPWSKLFKRKGGVGPQASNDDDPLRQ